MYNIVKYDIHYPIMYIISTVDQPFFSVLCFEYIFVYKSRIEAEETVSFLSLFFILGGDVH